jgi:alanyl-tRNA synthetase
MACAYAGGLSAVASSRCAALRAVTPLVGRGVRADAIIREIAKMTGGTGGGRPHMAQGGVGDASRLEEALASVPGVVKGLLEGNG